MNILSLYNAEDASVCLLKDGVLTDAIGEERLQRIKLYKGLPVQALDYVLNRHNLKITDIDHIVFGWNAHRHDFPAYMLKLLDRLAGIEEPTPEILKMVYERYYVEFERDIETREEFSNWVKELGVEDEKVEYFDHHSTHAWSAFCTSPFDSAFVFTMDARGDMKSGSVSIADTQNGVVEQSFNLPLDSLGFIYGQITHYLGYQPHRHEGKVTGLAAHGNPENTLPLFRRLISFNEGEFCSDLHIYRPFFTNLNKEMVTQLDQHSKEDIAAGVQAHCEELTVKFVEYWIEKLDRPDIKHVCMSGGLFANVLINQRVADIPSVEDIYISPHMGDGGLVVGAAARKNFALTKNAKIEMSTVYLGTDYSRNEIKSVLDIYSSRDKILIAEIEDKIEDIVASITNDKVVGYFDGRMEWGPRALGARSILYHTRDASVNDWLNKRLHRTEFMPFAPVTPVELAHECYKGWKPSHVSAQFMTRTYDCTKDFIDHHPAVVHVDGTARPQIVCEELHGDYYRLVKRYCELTGDKALINTSFNQHEEPIVCSPHDAIKSLINENVDVLYIGPFCIKKKK